MRETVRWYDRLGLLALVVCALAAAFVAPATPVEARPVSARRLAPLRWSQSCRWLNGRLDGAR